MDRTDTSIDTRVISIGTLSANPAWNERSPVRTGHATTTLIRTRGGGKGGGNKAIIVDPGLPAQAIEARLHERTGLTPADITHVFLTSFHPETRRGIVAFEHATWWISQDERELVGVPLVSKLQECHEIGDDDLRQALELDVAVLKRCEPVPDKLAPGVDPFPLPGVTPGLTGLLISQPSQTTLIAGDAVPTLDHFEKGQVLQSSWDLPKARESFAEAIEIADLIVPGRDNIFLNPMRDRPINPMSDRDF